MMIGLFAILSFGISIGSLAIKTEKNTGSNHHRHYQKAGVSLPRKPGVTLLRNKGVTLLRKVGVSLSGISTVDESKIAFADISEKSEKLMLKKYEEFESSIMLNADKIKSNKEKSFVFQEKQMNRIGIENIKQSRLNRLHKEKEIWEDTFQSFVQIVPTLSCSLIVKIVNE